MSVWDDGLASQWETGTLYSCAQGRGQCSIGWSQEQDGGWQVGTARPPAPPAVGPSALCLSQDGQSRTVRQFQFTDWPEQGVPKSGEGFIDFIGQVHKTKEQFGQDGPISVHCR